MKGGKIEDFMITWTMVLNGLAFELADEVLHELFHKQVKDFAGISDEMRHCRSLDEDYPNKSYTWLQATIEKYIIRTRQEKVRLQIHKGIGPILHPSAAAPKRRGKGKGKGKGKSGKGGKSQGTA